MWSEGDTEAGNESHMERQQYDDLKVYFHTFSPTQTDYLTVALLYAVSAFLLSDCNFELPENLMNIQLCILITFPVQTHPAATTFTSCFSVK